MIKCDGGNMEISGSLITLECDLIRVLRQMRKAITDIYKSETDADEMIDRCLMVSRTSDDGVNKEAHKAKK